MIEYKYQKVKGLKEKKFLENGHTMFEEDVLKRLKRLAHLEEQIKQGQLLPIDSVSDLFINSEYLMGLHPELNKEEAESLKEYAASRTIEYKECYGDGSIIYPKWKKENNR